MESRSGESIIKTGIIEGLVGGLKKAIYDIIKEKIKEIKEKT